MEFQVLSFWKLQTHTYIGQCTFKITGFTIVPCQLDICRIWIMNKMIETTKLKLPCAAIIPEKYCQYLLQFFSQSEWACYCYWRPHFYYGLSHWRQWSITQWHNVKFLQTFANSVHCGTESISYLGPKV